MQDIESTIISSSVEIFLKDTSEYVVGRHGIE